MAGVGADLWHVVNVATSMLLLLPTGDLLEGLVLGQRLLRIIIVSTHEWLLAPSTSRAHQLLLASIVHLLLMLIGAR